MNRASIAVDQLGRTVLEYVEEMGRIVLLFFSVLRWMFHPPLKSPLIFKQMEFVGNKSIFVVVLTGAFTGMVMALQGYHGFKLFSAESMVGSVVALGMVRELGPVLTALMVTARAGSAMAAELGTMRVTEQIDALDVMAAIKTHGILGDKYIELVPGTSGVAYIPEGGRISEVERQADLDKLLNQFGLIADDIKKVTGSLSTVLAGKEGETSIKDILNNTRQLTHNLNMVVRSNEATLRAVLENTRQLTENLNNVVTKNDEKMAQTIENLKGASKEMEKPFASLSDITESIKRGEGTAGQLIKDKEMAVKLNSH